MNHHTYTHSGHAPSDSDKKPRENMNSFRKYEKEDLFLRSEKVIEARFSFYTFFLMLINLSLHMYTFLMLSINPLQITTFAQFFHLSAISLQTGFIVTHLKSWIYLERFGVIYGLQMILSGWTLTFWVYPAASQRPEVIWACRIGFIVWWLSLMERRDLLSIVVWEFLTRSSLCGTLLYYRAWCLIGAAGGWVAIWELIKHTASYRMVIVEGLPNILAFVVWSILAGLFLTIWWSFWTFQFRGVVWRKEYREGLVVWFNDGYHQAAEVRSSYHLLSNGSHFWSL
ncbi:uncharacterized protein VTP21DRAFT_6251 [Calcarisporiella thermophila]|uniref:uncharacterized protein n=1 Tax=Calcarisporiella thermophila TaxID=911321 RepID=UPI00374493E9